MILYDYFNSLLPEVQIQDAIKKKRYERGEYLYTPSVQSNKVFEINRGVVKIGKYSHQGEELCFHFLYNNEIIGNLKYDDHPFNEFAKAVTGLEVTTYDLTLFKQYTVHDPLMSEWFNKTLIHRMLRLEDRLVNICSLPPKDRIVELIKEFNTTIICANGKKIWVPDLLTDKDMAQLTGLTRQTVSKILKNLLMKDQQQTALSLKKKPLPRYY